MYISANGTYFAQVGYPEIPTDLGTTEIIKATEDLNIYRLGPVDYAIKLTSENASRWHHIRFANNVAREDIEKFIGGVEAFQKPPENCIKQLIDERQGRDRGPKAFCTPWFGLDLRDEEIHWSTTEIHGEETVHYWVANPADQGRPMVVIVSAEGMDPTYPAGGAPEWRKLYKDKSSGRFIFMAGSRDFGKRAKTGKDYKQLCQGQKIIGLIRPEKPTP